MQSIQTISTSKPQTLNELNPIELLKDELKAFETLSD